MTEPDLYRGAVRGAGTLGHGPVGARVREGLVEDEVRKTAEELAAKPPLALALAKRTLAASLDSGLDAMLAAEGERQMRCFRSADAKEGISAFNEKRKPAFRGE